MVVERAGGRAPHGAPRRRVVDEPQEHVWSADLRQDAKRYETPEEKEITPRMPGASGPPGETASDARPDAVRPGAQYAQLAVPMPGPVPVPMPCRRSRRGRERRAADAVWKGIKGLKPEEGETFSDYMQRPLYNLGIKKKKKSQERNRERQRPYQCAGSPTEMPLHRRALLEAEDGLPGRMPRVAGAPHRPGLSSRGGQQEDAGERRPPLRQRWKSLTSFGDGPAICLIGNKSTQGTPHNAAHGGDGEIQSKGCRQRWGAFLGEGVDISVSHALAARPECSGEILTKTYDKFGRFDPDTPIRGTKNPIGKDSATSRLLNIVKPGTER